MEITEQFVDLVTRAHEYLTARQEALRAEYQLARWPRWDWDQDTGEIIFSEHGVPRVAAAFQFVRSVSTESGTWLWSWANPHIDPARRRDIGEVRQFGEAHGIAQLTTATWPADATDGWEMTSITAYVLQARGAYRTPHERGFTYLVFTDVRWAEGAGPDVVE